jgi:hypothetical protein
LSAGLTCEACRAPLEGKKTLWEYNGAALWLCGSCASLPMPQRFAKLATKLRAIDQAAKELAKAPPIPVRTDIAPAQLEELVLHAFLDLIAERKAAGRLELVATMDTIATWLSTRTTLPIKPTHVQSMTLALRDGLIIAVGGGGIGRPNSYDTREKELGIDGFWDQVDAFLQVWRLPNRLLLLQLDPA